MKRTTKQQTLNLLLAGKHPKIDRYAGKHVLVIENEIVPLPEGKEGLEEFRRLKKKHGKLVVSTKNSKDKQNCN